MSVKIKIRPNRKAMIKFDKPVDEQFFVWMMVMHRDDGTSHPKISIKNKEGKEILPIPKRAPVVSKVEPEMVPPTQITPIKPEIVTEAPKIESQPNIQAQAGTPIETMPTDKIIKEEKKDDESIQS